MKKLFNNFSHDLLQVYKAFKGKKQRKEIRLITKDYIEDSRTWIHNQRVQFLKNYSDKVTVDDAYMLEMFINYLIEK